MIRDMVYHIKYHFGLVLFSCAPHIKYIPINDNEKHIRKYRIVLPTFFCRVHSIRCVDFCWTVFTSLFFYTAYKFMLHLRVGVNFAISITISGLKEKRNEFIWISRVGSVVPFSPNSVQNGVFAHVFPSIEYCNTDVPKCWQCFRLISFLFFAQRNIINCFLCSNSARTCSNWTTLQRVNLGGRKGFYLHFC